MPVNTSGNFACMHSDTLYIDQVEVCGCRELGKAGCLALDDIDISDCNLAVGFYFVL